MVRNDVRERPQGLSDLHQVPLLMQQEEGLARLREVALGSAPWRSRKIAETRKVFGLEQLADRLTVLAVDATTDLRVVVSLHTPVPTLPPGSTDLVVEDQAELVLHYNEAILTGPLPGWAMVEILSPRFVIHANVSRSEGGGDFAASQRLCLGANIPRAYPLTEAILATYAAFTMQSVAIDERDPAGVMNSDAAVWWQENSDRIPLSQVPFLARAVR
jgi:hypothetical protein